ncbi:MAG: hypothetical protein FJ405_06220 [Verrucomicrobia bacterium]|nr:hypothetical protein [Verrucomicrobiota bacterium]
MTRFIRSTIAIMFGLAISIPTLPGAEGPAVFPVGGLKFKKPEKWTWVESTSSMRKAQLKAASSDGKHASEAVFFHFGPGGGGGVAANVDRWLGQFQESKDKLQSKTETITVAGHKVTYVQAQGTYLSGLPGGPKTPMPDTLLHGAVVEHADGDVFIRMTGPVPQMKSLHGEFRSMVESALKK